MIVIVREPTLEIRLEQIASALRAVIGQHAPQAAAVEEVFYSLNVKTALKLAHVRGVALLAIAEARVTLGEYSFVAAGAVITKDVLPYALMVGVPARRMGWMCQCGKRLNDSGVGRCAECGTVYERRGEGICRVWRVAVTAGGRPTSHRGRPPGPWHELFGAMDA